MERLDQCYTIIFDGSGAEVAGVGREAVVDVAAALSHLGGGIESAAGVRVLQGEALSCPHVGSPLGLSCANTTTSVAVPTIISRPYDVSSVLGHEKPYNVEAPDETWRSLVGGGAPPIALAKV